MISLYRAVCVVVIALLIPASSAANETDYDISVSVTRVRRSDREFVLRVEIRGPRGLSGTSEMRLRPGSSPRSESLSRGPDGTRKRIIHARLNEDGTMLTYTIEILHDDEIVARKSDVVNVGALPQGD